MLITPRPAGDQCLKPGHYTELIRRLRRISSHHDLATVIATAFDHRTRMLPFIVADKAMVPGGVRAIASALFAAEFSKTRIVLQQWNPRFDPQYMRLDNRLPDMFLISSMQIHTAACQGLLQKVGSIPPDRRPLVIAGGPKAIYEPWDVFSADPADGQADLAVCGEEYVFLEMLEALLNTRAQGESLRDAYYRAATAGVFDHIPGLMYPRVDRQSRIETLVHTGPQRILLDLDELPDPVPGYRLLEKPSGSRHLAPMPIPAGRVKRYCHIGAITMTLGCRFNCPYCPIPSYNQRQFRTKSGPRIADEMTRLYHEYGLRVFFGCDDNFINDPERALDIVNAMQNTTVDGKDFRHVIKWGTEATVHDVLKMSDHMKAIYKSGLRAFWMGVEDMSGTLVKKGQTADTTTQAFQLLHTNGIMPMPMMMHHDSQPLFTWSGHLGLLNQVRALRKAGAVSLQILMLTPAVGSRTYDQTYTSGQVFKSVAGRPVLPHMLDGNYVVASDHPKPWRKQLNILTGYLYFYNPLRFLVSLVAPNTKQFAAAPATQLWGMYGLAHTIRKTLGYCLRLWRGPITRHTAPPGSALPIETTENVVDTGNTSDDDSCCRQQTRSDASGVDAPAAGAAQTRHTISTGNPTSGV